MLKDQLKEENEITITFFQPDEKKSGGAYVTVTGALKKMDDFERQIVMLNGVKIPMDDVLDIEGELFATLQ